MLETEPQIIRTYVATGKAKIVYRHLLQLGDRSERASEASECAGDQGKFWEMRYTLYARQDDLYSAANVDGFLADLAQGVGVNRETFGTCLKNNTHTTAVQADFKAAQKQGIQARPVFIIGNERLVGAEPFETWERLLGKP